MRKLIFIITIVCIFATGCNNPFQSGQKGTAYLEADIDRKNFEVADVIESREMKSLIAEAEALAASMGSYIPDSAKQEINQMLQEKSRLKNEIQNFVAAYPDVELDTTLPEAEISEDAMTWIQSIIDEMENGENEESDMDNLPEGDIAPLPDKELGQPQE